MSFLGEQVLLRVYLDSADRAPHVPTYQRILKTARSRGLAGCTVLHGIAGYIPGSSTASPTFSLVQHVPVILEIVDSAQNIEQFIRSELSQLMTCGLATLERANVMMYRNRKDDSPGKLSLGTMLTNPLSTIPRLELEGPMTINETGVLLRIFIGESDRADGKTLYEAILQQSRQLGLASATVLRGSEGFGANSVVHKASLLEMSSDLPIVIEIVDEEDKVRLLLPYLEKVVQEGLITMENVSIIFYRHGPK